MRFCALLTVLIVALALPALSGELQRCLDYLDRGDFPAAAREAEVLVKQEPSSATAHVALARAYMGLNNAEGALAELRESLRHDPRSLDALYYLSKLTGILSQQQFVAVSEMAPDSARAHQIRAEVLEAQGDAGGAEREYRAALDKRPGTAYIMNALGDLMRHKARYEEATAWYSKVLAKDAGNYDALYGTAVSYKYSRSAEDAVPWYRRALRADPTSIAAKMALGQVLLLAGNAREAVPLLEEAARAAPNFRRLQFLLGRAYQTVGRPEDARRAFNRVRELQKLGDEEEPEDQ
jgi:Tfp pilus assembly protein PilF